MLSVANAEYHGDFCCHVVMSLMNNHNKLESLAQASLSNICKLDYTKNNYLYSSVFLI